MEHRSNSAGTSPAVKALIALMVVIMWLLAWWADAFNRVAKWSLDHPGAHLDAFLLLGLAILGGWVLWPRTRGIVPPPKATPLPATGLPGPVGKAGFDLSSLFHQTPDPLMVADLGGRILILNRAAQELTGWNDADVAARNPRWLELLSPSSIPPASALFAQVISGDRCGPLELELQSPQSPARLMEANLAAITAQGRLHAVLLSFRDVAGRKLIEDQTRQSQKLEAVGRLAGGMAHDFNNILTIIQGYTEVILATPNLSPVTASRLKQIASAAERAVSLTRQLLAFSRKQVMRPEPLDLNTALRNAAPMIERILGPKITLQTELPEGLPAVNADPDMMEEVLLNFSDNSRDAMPEGGRAMLRTSLKEVSDSDALAHPESRPGRYVCIAFTDTGRGMDAATVSHIFEPFFTTKEQGAGKGMGLASVYGIVKQHQGWVEVQSAPGAGTTFRVYLPVAQAAVLTKEMPFASPSAGGGNETILVVEDEAPLRALATVILRRNGYTTLEAGSGPEALEVWQDHRSKIHLLLTDMVMPGGMTGRDLALQLQADRSDLKVLYTSGYSRDVVQSNFELREGIRFLPKPYNSATLPRAVRECLDAPASASPASAPNPAPGA